SEANFLMAVADAAQAVFPPAIGARARMIVRKIFPGAAIRTVVLTDGAPLALADVRPPTLPMHGPFLRLGQTLFFSAHGQIGPRFLLTRRFAMLAAFASQIFLSLVQILHSTRFLRSSPGFRCLG